SCPSQCFFAISPRPPCPPLFPYTTLFRSRKARVGTYRTCGGSTHPPGRIRSPRPPRRRGGAPHRTAAGAAPTDRDAPLAWAAPTDRKSTRLNSSHVKNSYAVFCLKKKTKL